MEIYRGLGVEEKIREVGKELQPAVGVLKGTTLREALERLTPTQYEQMGKQMKALVGTADLSPNESSRGTQDLVEPVLLQEAQTWRYSLLLDGIAFL